MRIRILATAAFLLLTINLFSQQNPAGINWKYIDAGVYTIIFPEEITPAGERVADLMLHYEKYNYSDLKTRPRKIPIVLVNQNAESNGFVATAPFYSHWYTTPSSFDGLEWFRGLAIHEGRHMVQINKLKDGGGKEAWRILFGDYGTMVFQVLYIPAWYMEGDAVVMETAMTKGGRGRLPYFTLWQRGLELSGERYSYYQNYLGSYNSLYPGNDHYRLGYIMCSYIQNHYGTDVWRKVLERAGYYFLFPNFDSALENATGRNMKELYEDALNEYSLKWSSQIAGLKFTDADHRSERSTNRFDSYLFPSSGSDGRINALYFSNDKNLVLGSIDKKGRFTGFKRMPYEVMYGMMQNERTLSSGGGNFLWCETVPDPRWGYRSYLDLKLYDSEKDESIRLTDKRRFISSAISRNGETAAAIEYTPDLKYRISIFNIRERKELSSTEIENTGHIFDPAVSGDGRFIACASLSDSGNSLLLYNTETGKTVNLTGNTYNESFRSPEFFGKYLLYVSDYSGIDNIYAVDIEKKKRYQVTSRKFGAYSPSVDDATSTLLFNDYTINGYAVASMKLLPDKWIPLEKVERRVVDTIESIAANEVSGDFETAYTPVQNQYNVKDYYPLLHSINFFGWFRVLNSTDSEFFISFISRDVLHTTDIMISYIRNFNENTDAGAATLIYSGLYPVITLSGIYGSRAVRVDNQTGNRELDYMTWNESTGYASLNIPLNFSRGIHTTSVDFGGEAGYISISDKTQNNFDIYNGMNEDGTLNYYKCFFSFTHIIRGALASVTPGIGEMVQISYKHTPSESDYRGSILTTDMTFYLPGFKDTHGFILKGAYEKIEYDNYIFPSEFLFPRGYESVRYKQFIKGSIDYAFPVYNFSFNVWKLIYFKRINGAVFYDHGEGKNDDGYTYYRSAGVEVTAEHNLLSNLYLALEAGLRYSRCFDTSENVYEFIIRVPMQ